MTSSVRGWLSVSLPDVRKGESLLSRERYVEVMTHSAFAPAPMGNVVIETWRFWEALEYGAMFLTQDVDFQGLPSVTCFPKG